VKLRCERDTLVEALGAASRATATRGGSLQVLSGIRLAVDAGRLHAAGSDLDLTIETSAEVSSGTDGVAVAPGRLLVDIVRSFEPGAVALEADDMEMRISSGRAQFTVNLLPSDDFPRLPPREGPNLSLPASVLADALRQVVPAAASDDTRPMLTGVLITSEVGSGLRLVATDSYRLAKREVPEIALESAQKVLVPARALSELQRLLGGAETVTVRLGANDAGFEIGQTVLTTRLIEGEFPNYGQLIPSHYPNRLVVSREALMDAVRRVRLLVRDATTPVRMSLREGGIELSVVTHEVGQATEEIDAKYDGAEMTVAFNPAYLIDGLEACAEDEVLVEVIDGLKPATLRPSQSSDYLYLLMPVRVP
jgi:DNA polymerase-3 subunit beta